MRAPRTLGVSLAALPFLLVAACGDDEPAVPFGLDPHPPPSSSAPPTTVVEGDVAAEWADGSQALVDESPVVIEGAQIRATLARDVDGDGDRDVLVLATSPDGALTFSLATRSEAGLAFTAPVAAAPACGASVIGAARWAGLSSETAAARIERTCAGGASEQRVVVVRAGASGLRTLTTLVLAPQAGETMTVRGEDRDGDTHADVVVHLSLHDPSGESADVDLAWLDRAAGLSRDTAEPEAAATTHANEARTALRRHPDRALAAARTAILVHDALCGPRARLAVDDDRGLACPPSAALGRALSVAASAHARLGDLDDALAAITELSRADAVARDTERASAREAVGAMSGVLHPEPHDAGEAHAVDGGERPRLSSLAFLDEDRILVRGDGARIVTLSTGASAPTLDEGTALRDAEGQHAIAEIERSCEGYVLVTRPIFGDLASPSDAHEDALIVAAPPPAGAACAPALDSLARPRSLSALDRQDDGGYRVLGWAPQGALLAREGELVLVPLDVAGAPVGQAHVLAADEPAPAPIAPGHATSDASAWAFATPMGLVLHRRGQPATLVAPAGFDRVDGGTFDVAVSPSATRLAWIVRGRLTWVDLAAPPAPPVTETPPPPASEAPTPPTTAP